MGSMNRVSLTPNFRLEVIANSAEAFNGTRKVISEVDMNNKPELLVVLVFYFYCDISYGNRTI